MSMLVDFTSSPNLLMGCANWYLINTEWKVGRVAPRINNFDFKKSFLSTFKFLGNANFSISLLTNRVPTDLIG